MIEPSYTQVFMVQKQFSNFLSVTQRRKKEIGGRREEIGGGMLIYSPIGGGMLIFYLNPHLIGYS